MRPLDAELWPIALAVDRFGNLYVADVGREYIVKIDAISDTISIVVGGDEAGATSQLQFRPANEVTVFNVRKLQVDSSGRVYFRSSGVQGGVWRAGIELVDITEAKASLAEVEAVFEEYPVLSSRISIERSRPEDPSFCCRDDLYLHSPYET